MRLANRRALITGGASGIGAACARLFLSEGASVALIDRDEAPVMALAEKLQAETNGAVFAAAADVTDHDAVHAAMDAANASLGSFDVLVNCAGITARQRFDRTSRYGPVSGRAGHALAASKSEWGRYHRRTGKRSPAPYAKATHLRVCSRRAANRSFAVAAAASSTAAMTTSATAIAATPPPISLTPFRLPEKKANKLWSICLFLCQLSFAVSLSPSCPGSPSAGASAKIPPSPWAARCSTSGGRSYVWPRRTCRRSATNGSRWM